MCSVRGFMFLLWSSYSHSSLLDVRHNLSLFFMAPKHWRETQWSFFSLVNFYLHVHKSAGIMGKKRYHSVGTQHQTVKKKKIQAWDKQSCQSQKEKTKWQLWKAYCPRPPEHSKHHRNCLGRLLSEVWSGSSKRVMVRAAFRIRFHG